MGIMRRNSEILQTLHKQWLHAKYKPLVKPKESSLIFHFVWAQPYSSYSCKQFMSYLHKCYRMKVYIAPVCNEGQGNNYHSIQEKESKLVTFTANSCLAGVSIMEN